MASFSTTPTVTDTVNGQSHSVFKDASGKTLVETYEVRGLGHGSTKWHTARLIARQRVSAEAQEGFEAFAEKRRPSWAPPDE